MRSELATPQWLRPYGPASQASDADASSLRRTKVVLRHGHCRSQHIPRPESGREARVEFVEVST